MKFTALAGELSSALKQAILALDHKTMTPALGAVHIIAREEQITFAVDCLDRRIAATIPGTVMEAGEAAPPAEAFAHLLEAIPPNTVTSLSSVGDEAIAVTAGPSRFRIPGLPSDCLPIPPVIDALAVTIEIGSEDLLHVLEVTSFAIANEEMRYYLNGLYLHVANQGLRAVGTDGYRLAQCELPVSSDGVPSIIIPRRTVEAVIKLLRRKTGTVVLRVSPRLLEISASGLTLTSKLIDAKFPDYSRVIPAPASNFVTVARIELREALARLKAVADQKAKSHSAGLTWADGNLQLCLSREPGVAEDILSAKTTGSGRVAANINYLMDTLDALGGDNARVECSSPASPIRITNPVAADMLAVVMPIAWF
jgi:DNA polymerase-3 subunit beta